MNFYYFKLIKFFRSSKKSCRDENRRRGCYKRPGGPLGVQERPGGPSGVQEIAWLPMYVFEY
jgi:hypothetical protein